MPVPVRYLLSIVAGAVLGGGVGFLVTLGLSRALDVKEYNLLTLLLGAVVVPGGAVLGAIRAVALTARQMGRTAQIKPLGPGWGMGHRWGYVTGTVGGALLGGLIGLPVGVALACVLPPQTAELGGALLDLLVLIVYSVLVGAVLGGAGVPLLIWCKATRDQRGR